MLLYHKGLIINKEPLSQSSFKKSELEDLLGKYHFIQLFTWIIHGHLSYGCLTPVKGDSLPCEVVLSVRSHGKT